jgi:hypothetical protein
MRNENSHINWQQYPWISTCTTFIRGHTGNFPTTSPPIASLQIHRPLSSQSPSPLRPVLLPHAPPNPSRPTAGLDPAGSPSPRHAAGSPMDDSKFPTSTIASGGRTHRHREASTSSSPLSLVAHCPDGELLPGRAPPAAARRRGRRLLWQPSQENTVLSPKTDPLWPLSNSKVSSCR